MHGANQVEDIVDTGLTISAVSKYLLEECGATSVVTATLLDKHERRKLQYKPEYVGFVVSGDEQADIMADV